MPTGTWRPTPTSARSCSTSEQPTGPGSPASEPGAYCSRRHDHDRAARAETGTRAGERHDHRGRPGHPASPIADQLHRSRSRQLLPVGRSRRCRDRRPRPARAVLLQGAPAATRGGRRSDQAGPHRDRHPQPPRSLRWCGPRAARIGGPDLHSSTVPADVGPQRATRRRRRGPARNRRTGGASIPLGPDPVGRRTDAVLVAAQAGAQGVAPLPAADADADPDGAAERGRDDLVGRSRVGGDPHPWAHR